MGQEYKSGILTENGVTQWAVFERCYTRDWLVVARCPDEWCAAAIVAHMNGNIRNLMQRGHDGGKTCVPICSVHKVCALCGGAGLIERVGTGNCWGGTCPNAARLYAARRKRNEKRIAA